MYNLLAAAIEFLGKNVDLGLKLCKNWPLKDRKTIQEWGLTRKLKLWKCEAAKQVIIFYQLGQQWKDCFKIPSIAAPSLITFSLPW